MCDHQTFSTALSILTAIITGGFILVFIELGNRKNREYDSYTQRMEPFINKLSAFFRFICWCKSRVEYQKPIDGYEKQFKNLLDEIGLYGSRLILAGGNFSIDYFAVEELSAIMEKVNQIWYSYDRMERYRLNWKPDFGTDKFIRKELATINPNYLSSDLGPERIAEVSGEFFTEHYQPIEVFIYHHKANKDLLHYQTVFVTVGIFLVLLLLSLMLFSCIPTCLLKWSTFAIILLLICCLLMLGIDNRKQVALLNSIRSIFSKLFKREK